MNDFEQEMLLKIDTKIDEIKEKLNDHEVILAKQEANIQEHMRRTEISEEKLEKFEKDVKPILEGVSIFKTFAKIVSVVSAIAYSISRLFQ
jgi:predicted  nucleic acid-binding Zn-ribbon protein